MVAEPREWSWEEFGALPFETVPCDIHCVTKWSKLGTSFGGVSVDTLLEDVEPLGAYAMAHSYGGYTTNLAIEDLSDGKAWVVTEHEGEPLPREHGGPARLLVPHLYFWKSAKWVAGLTRHGPRRARLLGVERLPQPRRPLEGGALLERLSPVAARPRHLADRRPSTAIKTETPRMKSFRIALPMWMPHLPGQHYDVRLTAPDGYRAQRSYSIASSPLDEGEIELTIDRLDEARCPPTSTTSWTRATRSRSAARSPPTSSGAARSPVLLIGGGSGVVPLMAMLRHRRRTMPELPMRLLYSVREAEDVIYADELGEDDASSPTRASRRRAGPGTPAASTRSCWRSVAFGSGPAFICGSNGFVESASGLLLEAGYEPHRVLTERFGPTG